MEFNFKEGKFEMEEACRRHGGPFDRGMCASYYRRGFKPHFFTGDTYKSPEVAKDQMTEAEIKAYTRGFQWNEHLGDYKDYG